MFKQQEYLLSKIRVVIDLFTICFAFWMAYLFMRPNGELVAFKNNLWIIIPVIFTWYFLLLHYDLYASFRIRTLTQLLASLAKVHAIGGMVISSIIFFMVVPGFSPGLLVSFLLFSYLFLAVIKTTSLLLLRNFRRKGYNSRNVLIIGTGQKAFDFAELVTQHEEWGYRITGFLENETKPPSMELKPVMIGQPTVLGSIDDLVATCNSNIVDEVVLCVHKELHYKLEDQLRLLEEMGVLVRIMIDFCDVPRTFGLTLLPNDIPIITYYQKSFHASQLFLKRVFDISVAVYGLFIIAPLLPFIALAVRLDSPGPLFVSYERIGINGTIFRTWKFRTMFMNAKERHMELLRLNEMKGTMFNIEFDSLITNIGKLLRKTSLDELPQFLNVLRGDMSIIGTRPPSPDEVALYENWNPKRMRIKPGITGLWQMSGRKKIQNFEDLVRLDEEYIDRWSLWLDINILLKTCWLVFSRGTKLQQASFLDK